MEVKWWMYVILAGLSWGTYVPIIFFGGSELGGKAGSRLAAIMCVGVAYLVLAVVIPGIVFLFNQADRNDVSLTTNGIVFASLAGVMGAVGAICVVFASKEAMGSGVAEFLASDEGTVYKAKMGELKKKMEAVPEEDKEGRAAVKAQIDAVEADATPRKAKYRILIAPLIFSIAPIVNTLLASVWDPKPGKWANFGFNSPHWLFWVGVLLVGVGTGCVLIAKELGEQEHLKKAAEEKAKQLAETAPTTSNP